MNVNIKLIEKDYQGLAIQFTGEGWFNATDAASKFNRRLDVFLKTEETQAYLAALAKKHNTSKKWYLKTSRGKNGGTWFHPKLAVKFARWLSVDFEIWCDEQIDKLIRGELDAKRLRHQASASYKLMSDVLQLKRTEQGKETKFYHFANEARLINFALTGQFTALDRETLSTDELNVLAMLEERNALMIAAEVKYEVRKQSLEEFMYRLNFVQRDGLAETLEIGQC